MSIEDQIEGEYRARLMARDSEATEIYRLLRAAIKQVRIDRQKDLTDEDVIQILSREAKKRQEAAAEFEKSGRADLVGKELKELRLIQVYLPQPLSEVEVRELVLDAIREVQAADMKALGTVMKSAMAKVKGRADGQVVNRLAREILASSPPS